MCELFHDPRATKWACSLYEQLNRHNIDLSRRVKATEIVDLSALTEREIEAIAKRHMITTA